MLQLLLHLDQKTIITKILVPLLYESYEITVAIKVKKLSSLDGVCLLKHRLFLLVIIFSCAH